MFTNGSSTRLVFGLAVFGLGLVVAGVQLYQRHRADIATKPSEAEIDIETRTNKEEATSEEDHPDDPKANKEMPSTASERRSPFLFFLLVFALTIPFWLISSLLGNKLPIAIKLPISVFAFANPLIAAAILLYKRFGLNGVKELLKKTFDYKKIEKRVWYIPTLFLMPLIYYLTYLIMRLTGSPFPNPIKLTILMAPAYFILFFIGAIGEELGWSGYAIDPMQNRLGALKASIILGLIWQIWHIIGDIQAGNSVNMILWHGFYSIALRVLIVWIYNNTQKSVFAAILIHTMDNVSWSLFPNSGSTINWAYAAVLTCLVAITVAIGWGPKTLARFRFARVRQA